MLSNTVEKVGEVASYTSQHPYMLHFCPEQHWFPIDGNFVGIKSVVNNKFLLGVGVTQQICSSFTLYLEQYCSVRRTSN